MNPQQQVRTNGFAILPSVFPFHEIDDLIAALTKSFSGNKAGLRHILSHPAVSAVARHSRLVQLATDILATDAVAYKAVLFSKTEETNWLVSWHQDIALPLLEKRETEGWGPWSLKNGKLYANAPARVLEQVLALRIHLDESKAANGPLWVVPGTHHLGVLGEDKFDALSRQNGSYECLVPRGGVLAMRPLLVHGSSKSKSDLPRRVLHIEYTGSLVLENGLELAVA